MNKPPDKPYLSELKIQIEVIDRRLAALEDKAYQGALSRRFKPEDKEEAKKLLARKKELENRIIFYEP